MSNLGYAAGAWTLEKEKLFVYDGWNLVEEIRREGGTETSRYFVWGKDLSGSLQGAGGIGGLVAEVDGSGGSSLTYYFCYDGNGNVGQVVNAADGSIAAAYEYDPYGKMLKADGVKAGDNPFRFSTKYTDGETGLVYYGYRYYSSEMGRWVSRDPIGKKGGANLYEFVSNEPTVHMDSLGRKIFVIRRPLTFVTKSWTAYFTEGGTLAGGYLGGIPGSVMGFYLGKVIDYYRNNTWHCVLVVSCLAKNKSLDINTINRYDTWDFQADNSVYNPAADWKDGPFKRQYYTGRKAVETVVSDNSRDLELLNVLQKEPRTQKYILGGSRRYNCCDWVTKVLRKMGINYKAPNPQPFGDLPAPWWVPDKIIGKLIDKKYGF